MYQRNGYVYTGATYTVQYITLPISLTDYSTSVIVFSDTGSGRLLHTGTIISNTQTTFYSWDPINQYYPYNNYYHYIAIGK